MASAASAVSAYLAAAAAAKAAASGGGGVVPAVAAPKHRIAFGSRGPSRRDGGCSPPRPASARPAADSNSTVAPPAAKGVRGGLARAGSVCEDIGDWSSSDDEVDGGLGKRRAVVHVDASGKRRSVEDPAEVAAIRGLSPKRKAPAAAAASPPRPPLQTLANDPASNRRLSALPHFPPLAQPSASSSPADSCLPGSSDTDRPPSQRSSSGSSGSGGGGRSSNGGGGNGGEAGGDGGAKRRSINDVLGKRKPAESAAPSIADKSSSNAGGEVGGALALPLPPGVKAPPPVDDEVPAVTGKGATKRAGTASSRGQRAVTSFFKPSTAKVPPPV
jgi:uncharacterized membrane protein YgcG